jgi:hypothetical protein
MCQRAVRAPCVFAAVFHYFLVAYVLDKLASEVLYFVERVEFCKCTQCTYIFICRDIRAASVNVNF